jgi:hypothetical protein
MWRRVAILIVCGLAVIVAVWTSATPAAERFPDPTGALQAPETCHPLETGNPRTFEELTALLVTRLGESRLDCGASNADEEYRLTWGQAFDTHRITVTVVRTGDVVLAETREYGGQGPTPKLLSARERRIASPEWTRVRTRLANIEFWNLQPEPITVNDGSTWTLEGRAAGRYHLVWRQSPPDSPFRRVALDLLRLGGIRRP